MRKRFVSVDRTTPQMFPARIDDYLPEDHLARFVVDIVEQMDFRHLVDAYSGRQSSAYRSCDDGGFVVLRLRDGDVFFSQA